MKNKIKGIGLDTSHLLYKPDPTYLPENLYINTSSNNSFYLPKNLEEKNLIVEVGSFEGLREILEGLDLERIDTLLFPADSLKVRKEELGEILDEFDIRSVGISRPETLQQLKEAADQIKQVIIPSYIALEISPVHFQKEIIDWAELHQLEILGLNPFGGFILGPTVIQSFSIPFLLSFSAAYSDVVFLSGRDLVNSQYNSVFLEELIGKDRLKEVEMKKTVIHQSNPLPKIIYTGLKLGDGVTEYENPEFLATPEELIMKMDSFEMMEGEKEENEEVVKILKNISMFDTIILPHPENPKVYLSIIRPHLLKELGKSLGQDYKIEQAKIGEHTFLVDVRKTEWEKRYLWKDKKIEKDYYFILTLSKNGDLKFIYYQNSVPKP